MEEEPSALKRPRHPSDDVTRECVCLSVHTVGPQSGLWGVSAEDRGCQVERWHLCSPWFRSSWLSECMKWLSVKERWCNHLFKKKKTPFMFSSNLKPLRSQQQERWKKRIVKEAFGGPKCQRYHYLSIPTDETHLAGLVSRSGKGFQVTAASNHNLFASDSRVTERKKKKTDSWLRLLPRGILIEVIGHVSKQQMCVVRVSGVRAKSARKWRMRIQTVKLGNVKKEKKNLWVMCLCQSLFVFTSLGNAVFAPNYLQHKSTEGELPRQPAGAVCRRC